MSQQFKSNNLMLANDGDRSMGCVCVGWVKVALACVSL